MCFYYNAQMTMNYLESKGLTASIFKVWFELLDNFS